MVIFHLFFQQGLRDAKKDVKHPSKKQVVIDKCNHKIKVNKVAKVKKK